MPGPEYTYSEKPFIDQLVGLGWTFTEGDVDVPELTFRGSFREVLLEQELRDSLVRINPGQDGQPWLDEHRVSQAVHQLTRIGSAGLLEANENATGVLLAGAVVDGLPDWNQGRGQRALH